MKEYIYLRNQIFKEHSENSFTDLALKIFIYQYQNNHIYRLYIDNLKINPYKIKDYTKIPFLPIEFFKHHKIITGKEDFLFKQKNQQMFISSGTSSENRNRHYISDINIYKRSILSGFNFFFGKIENYVILSFLPPSAIREESSLIYMINLLIEKSKNSLSEVIQNKENLTSKIELLNKTDAKTILIALSYSLLDYAETNNIKVNNNIIIMDTGGMKGKRKEITREELHSKLKYFFGTQTIHSEYSMTELLSQAYSKGEGIYSTPPWMKILIRDINDPLASEKNNKTGGINIIDLANINSCSFISTYDLGVRFIDGRFKIFGRFDNSDIRGCSLLTY